eukprot:COSAG02_NODE_42037_length_388_cov_1.048443_2_plen_39_part_01
MMTKRSIENVALEYPQLKFKLADHAEDFEKMEKLNKSVH